MNAHRIFILVLIILLASSCGPAVSTMLNRIIRDLVRSHDETIQGWAAALETRDSETLGHSQRVVDLTWQLARKWESGAPGSSTCGACVHP